MIPDTSSRCVPPTGRGKLDTNTISSVPTLWRRVELGGGGGPAGAFSGPRFSLF